MKITIYLFVLGAICAQATNSEAQSGVDIGIKAGLSIPNLTAKNSDNPINSGYSSRTGPAAAIHAEFHLSKKFSVQPELQYCSEGGKKNGSQAFSVPPEWQQQFPGGQAPDYLYADYKSTAKFNYLILGILAKYHFVQKNNWDIYAAAGPFVSRLVYAKNVTSGTSTIYLDPAHTMPFAPDQSFDRTEDIRDQLHKFNAGITGHVGVAYHFGKNSVFLEGGGNYGLINIQKGETNGKNNAGAAVIVAGYTFTLSCK